MSLQASADKVFDALDMEVNGYLTAEQVRRYHCEQHMCELSQRQVDAAVQKLTKGSSTVRKDVFVPLLKELFRRCKAATALRWDFEMLDYNHRRAIPVEKCQFLFKATRNQMYSTAEFQEFLKRRNLATADVALEEIEVLLCDLPDARFVPDVMLDDAQLEEMADLRQQRQRQERARHRAQRMRALASPAESGPETGDSDDEPDVPGDDDDVIGAGTSGS